MDENHEWLSRGYRAVSCFGLNERDPVRRRHVEERELRETTHFTWIWNLEGWASFLRNIKFCLSDLRVICEQLGLVREGALD